MYIQRLELKNIRCFEEITIDFKGVDSSLLILGDNSDGKSTILKCLAMGLCDVSSASALLRELPGEFIRRQPGAKEVRTGDKGHIEITLQDKDQTLYRIKTTIISTDLFERVIQDKGLKYKKRNSSDWESLNQDTFPWEKIFVSGYGASSRTHGTEDFSHYLAVDAVYSIFKPELPLQNPELVIRRLIDASRKLGKNAKDSILRSNKRLKRIKQTLSSLLKLENEDCFVLSESGIKVSGSWGISEIGELGDGYNATITWVFDMLSWWFLHNSSTHKYQSDDISGIVIIDEIEQHLHPRWQLEILALLNSAFPKIQFIISTHSPLCVAGTADIGEEKYQIIGMERRNGKVEPIKIPIPIGYRADQILTSIAFGLEDSRNKDSRHLIRDYRELSMKEDPSPQEKKELERLRILVQDLPEVGQYEKERKARKELSELLEEFKKEMSKGKTVD